MVRIWHFTAMTGFCLWSGNCNPSSCFMWPKLFKKKKEENMMRLFPSVNFPSEFHHDQRCVFKLSFGNTTSDKTTHS